MSKRKVSFSKKQSEKIDTFEKCFFNGLDLFAKVDFVKLSKKQIKDYIKTGKGKGAAKGK